MKKWKRDCEGEDLGVANGRISPSRSPFLATAEKRMAGMVWGRRLNMEKVLVVQKIGR